MNAHAPRVLAVLVVHDGVTWLGRTLEGLGSQDHEALEVVAVDNASTDGSRDLLLERLGPDAVLLPERDLGFGGAVAMALDAQMEPPDLLLLVHDDLVLAPDAVRRMVDELSGDEGLAAVGPKLRWLDDERRLQSIGFSVDLTGRIETGLEADEIDHGHRDARRDVLAVSSAGMLVRRTAFEEVGGFDRRYHVFRDDLDLCWRLWLRGHRVGVVPAAVGLHARAASDYRRLGQARTLGPRYFAERNTLATLLKVRGAGSLVVTIPLYLVLGLVRVLAFLATRRFTDAWQTIRSWLWNVVHLRETLRLRREVQRTRVRSSREVRALLVRLSPRLRGYAEAVADFLTGGTDVAPAIEEPSHPLDAYDDPLRRTASLVRRRPLALAGGAVVALVVVASAQLWRAGPLRGGDLAPWPERAADLFGPYTSAWHVVPGIATDVAPSPATPVLGFLTLLAGGSEWLAPRLLLLLALPLAWLFTVRAVRELTMHTGARAVAALVYTLSPPVLAAVRDGRLGAIVVAVLLPAAVAAAAVATRPQRSPGAWRGAAALVLVLVVMVGFEPAVLVAVPVVVVGALGMVVLRGRGQHRRPGVVRLLAMVGAGFLLLLPWLGTLLARWGELATLGRDHALVGTAPWRLVLLAPDAPGFVGPVPGALLVAAALVAVLLAGDRRPLPVLVLWLFVAVGVVLAAVLANDTTGPWPGLGLLVAALALAALTALGTSEASRRLREHAFGWRQVGSLAALTGVVVGALATGAVVATGSWPAWTTEPLPIPAFVASDAVGDFDVLVLVDSGESGLQWQFVGPDGPGLEAHGMLPPAAVASFRRDVVESVVGRTDPSATARLGAAGVRYVVVPERGTSPQLTAALEAQLDLEPRAVVEGQLYEVASWRPRVHAVAQSDVVLVADEVVPVPDADVLAFTPGGDDGTWSARDVPAGLVTIAAPASPAWLVTADGLVLEPTAAGDVARFVLPADADRVEVRHARQARWTVLVVVQTATLLVVLSLLLRPPSFSSGPPARVPRRSPGAATQERVEVSA